MSHARPSPEQHERELVLRRELELLGEEPPSAEELALVLDGTRGDPGEVAVVSRLTELAAAERFDPLSELELHRVWRSVEQRAAHAEPDAAGPAGPTGHGKQATKTIGGGGARRWLLAAVGGLAAAAAVLFVVLGPGRDEARHADAKAPSSEQVAEMGDQVRATLQALDDGKSDSERAAELAAEYQRRLAQRQEHDG
jgi:hypothetical protein